MDRWVDAADASGRAFPPSVPSLPAGASVPPPSGAPAAALPIPVGSGHYELVSKLATGGMAELFLAQRRGLAGIAQHVVIKRLRREVLTNRPIVRMFLWEAWISSRLCHPNIVRFHDLLLFRDRYHIVFEHVPGADVSTIARHVLRSGASLPIEAALDVGIHAMRALDHAHRLTDDQERPMGLVHRDISPHNLLVSTEGEVKVCDFGVAKTTSEFIPRQTAVGLVKGKIAYVAPEQLRDEPMDGRSDQFSMGVTLFEMVSGTRLFVRDTDLETLRAVERCEIPPLRRLRPDCPEELEAIVVRALSRDPAQRFESALAMARALGEVRARAGGALHGEVLGELARGARAESQAAPPAVGTEGDEGDEGGGESDDRDPAILGAEAAVESAEPFTSPEGACARARERAGAGVTGELAAPPAEAAFETLAFPLAPRRRTIEVVASARGTVPSAPVAAERRRATSRAAGGAATSRASRSRVLAIAVAFIAGAIATAVAQATEHFGTSPPGAAGAGGATREAR